MPAEFNSTVRLFPLRRRVSAGLALVLLTCAAAAEPADDTGAAVVFEVTPPHFAPAVMMPNAGVPEPPGALEPGRRDALLQALGGTGGQIAEDTIVRLSAAHVAETGRAFLVLTEPRSLHPESSIRFAADPPGEAALRLKVARDTAYLVDFAVTGEGPGSYRVAADGGERTFDDVNASARHVAFGIRALDDGWTMVRLRREGGGFFLFGVEVTTVNPAPPAGGESDG